MEKLIGLHGHYFSQMFGFQGYCRYHRDGPDRSTEKKETGEDVLAHTNKACVEEEKRHYFVPCLKSLRTKEIPRAVQESHSP